MVRTVAIAVAVITAAIVRAAPAQAPVEAAPLPPQSHVCATPLDDLPLPEHWAWVACDTPFLM